VPGLVASSTPPHRSSEGSEGDRKRLLGLAVLAALVVIVLAAGAWTQTDLDGDDRTAFAELAADTSPFDPDTDGDGLDDGFEHSESLHPKRPDTDGDGLDDRDELLDGTNPRAPDSDDDGPTDPRERALGTTPLDSDTDQDEVADGRELDIGTDPTRSDTDADGVPDGDELVRGANPTLADTDGDELEDLEEYRARPEDCDADDVDRIAETDDDNDQLVDAIEPEPSRCKQDVDGDGIVDGYEQARACILEPDCDGDGLTDADELDTAFDRLDPDTFDAGLLDGTTSVFQQNGQPPSADADDGIPDAWETSTGLIDWTLFDPEPDRQDFLVEFVRVEGPDSARYGPGPMTPVYEQVETFLEAEGNVEMAWTETTVALEEEQRPPRLPSARASYYETVLDRARASDNPFVTTVVLNPQHDQSERTHQGVAPIRGMLAAVDYGSHTRLYFNSDAGTLTVSPLVESLIVAERTDLLGSRGVTDGGRLDDGRMYLDSDQGRLTWNPFWFKPPVVLDTDQGPVEYERTRTVLDEAELADTVAHELGHTLGLCHNTLPSCQANLSAEDRDKVGVSTMDPRREGPELEFLPSEWDQVRTYLSCPPQSPIRAIAEGATRDEIIQDKYAITLENALDVGTRRCEDFTPLPADLEPDPAPVTYRSPYAFTDADRDEPSTVYEAQTRAPPAPPDRSRTSSHVYGLGTLILAGAAATGLYGWRSRSRQ
jgi:hypothetical protein